MFHRLTKKKFRSLAFEFAEKNEVPNRFNCIQKLAGEKWVRNFKKRHSLLLRPPEQVSVARAMCFNKVSTNRYFDNLKKVCDAKKFTPDRIFNMDEMGISTSPSKPPKVITSRGKKVVGKISSAEKGQTVTVVASFSVSGIYVTPTLIFPRNRPKPELIKKAPFGTLQLCSDSGFINTELFLEWLTYFQKYTGPSKDDPVLLILDSNTSHCSIRAIDYCNDRHIILLSLPPYSSHRTQPLDVAFFSSLKAEYARQCEMWLAKNPGRVITMMQVGKLFGTAYNGTATIAKAVEGFRTTGIFPYNRDIFPEEYFRPSKVTESKLKHISHLLKLLFHMLLDFMFLSYLLKTVAAPPAAQEECVNAEQLQEEEEEDVIPMQLNSPVPASELNGPTKRFNVSPEGN